MPGPITYAAVTLLARDRIGQIKRALAAKKGAGTAKKLELHVLHLATEAERIMKASEPVIEPPVRLYGPPLTDQVSRFLLLGAVGPDLPRYAAYFAPGQRWLFDTLHKGTPDEHREKVLANTTNLVFDFWTRVDREIDDEFSAKDKRTVARDKMRAYVLGHVCHIATDVLSHPYFEAIEARLAAPGPPPVRFMSRDDVAAAFDVRVSDTFFGRDTDTRTKQWADWFPTPREVPNSFAKAMAASIEKLYGARAEGRPAFEEAFKRIKPAPPPLSKGLINESIESFRTIIEIGRVWTLGDWLGATAAMFLPMAFAYLGALALPLGKDLSRTLTDKDDGPGAEDIRTYEWVVFPLAASSLLGPLVTMIIVSASGRGLRAEGVTGWVQALLSLGASIGFFATRGGAGAARWALWFALPLGLGVAQIIFALARGGRESSRMLLWLGPLVQVLLALIFMLLYRVWLHEGVEELPKDADERDDGKAFGFFAAWIAIVVALWIGHALLWRYVFSASVPDDRDELERAEPRQFLRLYDDVALVHDATTTIESDKLADLAYPPGRRPLLKLWWEAGTAPSVKLRIDHDRLVFHWDAPPGTADQSVFAPIAPTTVDGFGTLLAAAVKLGGTLHVKPVRDDEKGFELAPGAVFADHGDEQTTVADHKREAESFKDVGTSEAAAFTLFHAPRPRLAQRMGRSGVAPDAAREEQRAAEGSTLTAAVDGLGAVIPRRYHASNDENGTSPLLRKLLRPGDTLEILSAVPLGERRVVERVLSETDVVVSSAFTALPAAGLDYKRATLDRAAPALAPITLQTLPPELGLGPNDVEGVGLTPFGAFLRVGDVISIATAPPQRRRVAAVRDFVTIGVPALPANLLELNAPLAPATTTPVAFTRLSDAEANGFKFIAAATDVFGEGGSVMNDAADLAALLCLGAASRLASHGAPATPATTPVHGVYHVFRNWNLDRRRVNEWKLLVSGGAVSERRGDFRGADEAAPMAPGEDDSSASDALIAKRREGERIVRERGILPAFRSWMEVAARPRNDVTASEVFRPGQPTNQDLSRAVAYLLDAHEAATP